MKEALIKLLKVKSIVTLLLTLVICYLAVKEKINIEQIYLIIIGFYFGTQVEKKENNEKK